MTPLVICFVIVALCRLADLASTFLVSPDLRYELNGLYRFLGWRLSIVINIILCLIAADERGWFFGFLIGFSILATAWNLNLFLKNTC